MSALPTPVARRLPRSRWLDARLLLGVLLVLLSVVIGARLFAAADDTVPVWASTTELGPGVVLSAGDLVARRVRLEAGADSYVGVSGPPPVGRVLVRPVGKGELLPLAALAGQDAGATADVRRVGVSVTRATGLSRGSVVDVYQVPSAEAGREAPPAALVMERVTVAQVEEAARALGGPSNRDVVLLLPTGDVRRILDAQARGRIELVQVPQGSVALRGS